MKMIPFLSLSLLLAAGLATSAAAQSPSSSLKSVMDHYVNIQNALARDSMENVAANANALVALARDGNIEGLPASAADEAAALAEDGASPRPGRPSSPSAVPSSPASRPTPTIRGHITSSIAVPPKPVGCRRATWP